MQKVAPTVVAEGLTEFCSQQVIGRANGNLFKVAKGIGSTTWHTHEDQEKTFLLLRGELTIQLRSGDVHLDEPGDLFDIPSRGGALPAGAGGGSLLACRARRHVNHGRREAGVEFWAVARSSKRRQ